MTIGSFLVLAVLLAAAFPASAQNIPIYDGGPAEAAPQDEAKVTECNDAADAMGLLDQNRAVFMAVCAGAGMMSPAMPPLREGMTPQ